MRAWLRNIRNGESQRLIAKNAGITQQMYSKIERGERTPSVDVAKKVAVVLGFDWTRFYDDEAI